MAAHSLSFSLDRATSLTESEHGVLQATTDAAFWTLIGPFGGWSAAVVLRAVMQSSDSEFVPVSLNVHFAGAMTEGSVDVLPVCVRHNCGTEFWRISLEQESVCAIDAQVVMAARRETRSFYISAMPEAVCANTLVTTEFPQIPWTMTYDCRFVTAPPVADTGSVRSLFWVRLRCDEPVTFYALASLCDACVPRPFFLTKDFFPVSTISMSIQIHAKNSDLASLGHEFMLVEAWGDRAGRGFFDQHLRVWSPEGVLLASSAQLFWYKA